MAIKTLGRFRPHRAGVLHLTSKLCVKYGKHTNLSEAASMRFISQHTSIPVPRIVCSFIHDEQTYIVMERIQGNIIGSGWVSRSEESKAKLLAQLATMIREMRELNPPEGMGVASVDGGSLYDGRLPGPSRRFGPFDNQQDFHRHLREDLEFDTRLPSDIQDMIKQQSKPWPLKFTHGDLRCPNILVRGDKVVGIVDWEASGWYPSYWEYAAACQINPLFSFWGNEIDKFLQPIPEELVMEHAGQKFC